MCASSNSWFLLRSGPALSLVESYVLVNVGEGKTLMSFPGHRTEQRLFRDSRQKRGEKNQGLRTDAQYKVVKLPVCNLIVEVYSGCQCQDASTGKGAPLVSGVIFFSKVSQKVSQPKAENIPRKHILIRFFKGITFPLNFIFQRQHARILTSPLIVNVQ